MAEIEIGSLTLVWLVAAIAAASLISSVTGMAGGVLMFAAMGTVFPLRPLVAIHGAVQVFNNAARGWFLRRDLRWSMCLPFAAGAAIGAGLVAVFVVRSLDEFYPLLMLLCLILYTLFRPRQMPQLQIADRHFFWVGILTGGMGILVGAIDPLLAVFFFRDDLSKEEIVSNKSLMQMFAHLTKIPAYLYLGFSFVDHAALIAVFTLAAVVGARIGVALLRTISAKIFFTLMRVALAIAAGRICYQLLPLLPAGA